MNAAVTIMQATDWSKYSLEGWLRQFGAWINGNTEVKRKFYKSIPKKKLTEMQRIKMLEYYMKDESFKEPVDRKGVVCQLSDNEARAFQRIILDIRNMESEVLQDWMDVLWEVYVDGVKLRAVATTFETSTIQIRQDLKCGLAFISGRYPNLVADLLQK